jgi:hypothetical protein
MLKSFITVTAAQSKRFEQEIAKLESAQAEKTKEDINWGLWVEKCEAKNLDPNDPFSILYVDSVV